ncbi:hypothetical protein POM88_052544 [Heracleum sosnowskyi]|uniref:NIN-like protein n=1 Tax=Heracleum sosnowskyi TaxID=360622 RepID=A0AAD8GRW0_9APIA|nr:hypothetical protein POM88_052544 [Heracleum sosnowskyi]
MDLCSDENPSFIQLREKIFVHLERFYCSVVEKTRSSGNILIQYWAANIVTREKGRQYCELRTRNQLFYHDQSDDTRLLSYRNHVVARSFRVHAGQEEADYNEQWQELLGATGRVFCNKRVEVSPNVSHYSTDEYPQRDFALSCGIQASLCLPLFATNDFSGHPNGVIEIVFTSEEDFHHLKPYIYYYHSVYSTLMPVPPLLQEMTEVKNILRFNIFRISISQDVFNEIDHVLTVVSKTFQIPLAQCWLSRDHSGGDYTVINQKSSLNYENLVPWCQFKKACSQLYLNMGDGLVGRTFMSHTPSFFSDITKVSIRSYPLAHYIGNCGSTDSFTVCLHNPMTGNEDYVMEFFLPREEMDGHYPESLLNSLFETLRTHFKTFVLASGEKLGEEITVKVFDSFMHHESESFKIGHPKISSPRQRVPRHVKEGFPLTPSTWKSAWSIDGDNVFSIPCISPLGLLKQLEQNVQVIEASSSSNNSSEEDILIEEASTKWIEPQSLSYRSRESLPQDKIVQDDGESPVEDVGYAMTTKSQLSSFQTKKSLPRQEGKEDTTVLDPPAQKLMLGDALQIRHKGLTLGTENVDTHIHILNKSRVEVTSHRDNNSEESISFESLTKHFGRPLDDAAKSFGVSRSTFKRVCRGHGIKRWQFGKKRMGTSISSKLGTKLNDKVPSRRKLSCSGKAPVTDTAVVPTRQNMNKMIVKATYNDVTIRFELFDLSGLAELQDNVIERLQLERSSFSIKYQDDEGDWILIACDKDVRECMELSRSLNKTTIKMLLDLPIIHYAT